MWVLSGKCHSKARMDGKVVIITGANSGIGKETALDLVRRGATVVLACRSAKNAKEAIQDIRHKLSDEEFKNGKLPDIKTGRLAFVPLDLSSLKSVRKCAHAILDKYPQIHILINNAGIFACDRGLTEDDIELQMGTNHMGHFLLTCMLLPRMIESKPSRIINITSVAHRFGHIDFDDFNSEKSYSPLGNYGRSKLANVLFTKELAKRLKEKLNYSKAEYKIDGVTTYAVHPGIVATKISRHLSGSVFPGFTFTWNRIMGPFIKNPVQGAQTTLYCALDEKAGNESGYYYSDCRKTRPSARAKKGGVAEQLWTKSVDLTNVNWNPFTEKYDPEEHGVVLS